MNFPCSKVGVGVLGALNVLLMVAVAVLGAWPGSRCRLRPRGWLPFGDRCYWVSEEVKRWRDGCGDCETKRSRLLVLRDREEMERNRGESVQKNNEFVRNVTQAAALVWIGLSAESSESSWTWADGSASDRKLRVSEDLWRFHVKGDAESNGCGVIRKGQINSESCNAEFRKALQFCLHTVAIAPVLQSSGCVRAFPKPV
ncbi:killer cell lectin-like receptor subfamily F member 1 [Apteryx rowi]|uniref:killer cell lectin-like receptor subfamily F member 1 n=1 Tax=Apteryx rowi TaxID=308060 RepID=UPI000E1E250D|nr:killer cell lectin-like receptor subfamily F member 1 [Apteryx rowi]